MAGVLESIVLAHIREREKLSGWCFTPAGPLFFFAVSLLGSVHAHLCQSWALPPSVCKRSLALLLLACFMLWESVTSHYWAQAERRGFILWGSKWRKMYKSCLKKEKKEKKVGGCEVTPSLHFGPHTNIFTNLICPWRPTQDTRMRRNCSCLHHVGALCNRSAQPLRFLSDLRTLTMLQSHSSFPL